MTTTDQPVAARPRPLSQRQILVLLGGLMLGMLLASLDQTIVGTALPTIVGKLGGLNHYSWVVTSYLLFSTASTPLYGKISDLYGRRRIFLFAISTFLVGSLLAGASQNMTQLIIFRGIQGLGAGGLMTLAFTIISDVVSPRDRGRYQGLFGAVFGLSSVAGPLVGGYFAQHDWRWIFYVNLPIGIVALIVSNQVLRRLPRRRLYHKIDYPGALLLVAGVVAILLGLSWGGTQYAWRSPVIISLFVAGGVLSVLFVLWEARASEPILPLRLFRLRTFSLSNAGSFILGFAMFGAIIFIPLYLQVVKGASPTKSGLLLLPMMVGVIFTSIVSGAIISRIGRYKWFPVFGTVLLGAGLLVFTRLQVDTPLWESSLYMLLVGVGLGMTMQPLILAVQNDLPARDLGAGTSAATFFRSLGGSFGVAALGAVLTTRLNHEMATLLPAAVRQLPPAAQAAFAHSGGAAHFSLNAPATILALPAPIKDAIQQGFVVSLHGVFLLGGVTSVLAVLTTLFLPNHELRGTPVGMAATVGAEGEEQGTGTDGLDAADEDDAARMEARAGSIF